jgi:3-(3-hydroxy-phenyl)propionate hydroxylase
MVDAPLGNGWLVDRVGLGFTLLTFGKSAFALPGVTVLEIEEEGLARQRYDARVGTAYLVRPDRYVAARWRQPSPEAIRSALDRGTGRA